MTYAWGDRGPSEPDKAKFNYGWGVDAPWAHPIWSQYVAMLYDLETDTDVPPVIHLPGATHEFLLFAIDPEHPLVRDKPIIDQRPIHWLEPANYGYQFRAKNDGAALGRCQAVIDAIAEQRLSPDTDFRSAWNAMWKDAYPMVRSRIADAVSYTGGGRFA